MNHLINGTYGLLAFVMIFAMMAVRSQFDKELVEPMPEKISVAGFFGTLLLGLWAVQDLRDYIAFGIAAAMYQIAMVVYDLCKHPKIFTSRSFKICLALVPFAFIFWPGFVAFGLYCQVNAAAMDELGQRMKVNDGPMEEDPLDDDDNIG